MTSEGIQFTAKSSIEDFDDLFCSPKELVNWNRSTTRYQAESVEKT
jgi:hypothetical protein